VARRSAEERREEIIAIAFRHFGDGGYHGTSTEAIAREAGISQPYLFRLFKTKRGLFLACTDRCFEIVTEVFRATAAAAPEGEKLAAMGHAYEQQLLPDRTGVLFQTQAYATSDPEIRDRVRSNFRELIRNVAAFGGVDEDETWEFFATGMLLNVTTMLDIDWMPKH
jgi:AcrR family transcriptional regulator